MAGVALPHQPLDDEPTKHVLALLLWMRLRAKRTPIVWTVHNGQPHEDLGPIDQVFYRLFISLVTHRIALSSGPAVVADVVIPHGDYRGVYAPSSVERAVPPQILYFGLVRPYKGVERLIDAFDGLEVDAALVVRGRPVDEEYAETVRQRAAPVAGVMLGYGHVDDADVPDLFAQSSLVVLPYSHLSNSGVLLLALSLARPVLAPRVPATEEIQNRVGSDWVQFYDDELTSADLARALKAATALGTEESPDLSYFAWDRIGEQYAAVFRGQLSRANRG